ncbi:DUF5362 family protein [Flavobacterium sp. NRK1]|uniref:DUF5362 family protein n=1 Tax=Flavobacterium sp. NRK1 TaxID=2954929 RepID=UPI002093DA9A|nr:DUF5362 family protein [Flavobacterium sp. NRK1]MCO6149396.1 DUF5362 family protein [Flavobacterium sp. NRK1]
MEQNSPFESFEMQISESAKGFLKTAAGWSMFLSIIGFIGLAFSLLSSFAVMAAGSAFASATAAMGGMSGMAIGLILLIFCVLFFIPVLFLFKFSTSTRQALNENSTEGITKALGNLKSYFMWSGILTIIWIVSYIGFIIVVATAAATMRGSM